MEYILQPDGALRFDAPDRIAAFARDRGLRLFGHTLVWYAQGRRLRALTGTAPASPTPIRYILAVVGRYRGQVVGWDVVNEAVARGRRGLARQPLERAAGRDRRT